MSEKTRKKKDGRERNKDTQAMHDAVNQRKNEAAERAPSGDVHDHVTYKRGSNNDRTQIGAR